LHEASHGAPAWISEALAISFVKSPEKLHAGAVPPELPLDPLLLAPESVFAPPLLLVLPPLLLVDPVPESPFGGFDGGSVVPVLEPVSPPLFPSLPSGMSDSVLAHATANAAETSATTTGPSRRRCIIAPG
jgi:hypothetical protein